MKPNIIICCDQQDCKWNTGRWVYQKPSHRNDSMFNNVCVHPKPDINDKNEPQNRNLSDKDAYRTNCKSYFNDTQTR